MSFEKLNEKEQLIIVPIADNYISRNNKNKPVTNYLVLIETEEKKIRKGNIVQYLSEDKITKTAIPKNLLHNYYNDGPLKGQLTFLSVADRYEYEIVFKENRLYSMSVISEKNGAVRTEVDCIDWFLVTYYYNPDGTYYTTEEWVGRTCGSGNCANVECLDPGGGGNGDGGGGSTPDEPVADQRDWEVKRHDNNWYLVWATEGFTGLKTSRDGPFGGHFTGMTHQNDLIANYNQNETFTWQRSGVTVNYTPYIATAAISGQIVMNSTGFTVTVPTRYKSWAFNQIFP